MYEMKLEWKEHNVDLRAVEAWMKANTTGYLGNSADSCLHLWFEEEPSQEDKDAAQAYWDGLDENSDEAQSYESAADLEAARLAKKASAKAKLIEIAGLTEEEAAALLG